MNVTIDDKKHTYESIAKLVRSLPFKELLNERMRYPSLEELTSFLYQLYKDVEELKEFRNSFPRLKEERDYYVHNGVRIVPAVGKINDE